MASIWQCPGNVQRKSWGRPDGSCAMARFSLVKTPTVHIVHRHSSGSSSRQRRAKRRQLAQEAWEPPEALSPPFGEGTLIACTPARLSRLSRPRRQPGQRGSVRRPPGRDRQPKCARRAQLASASLPLASVAFEDLVDAPERERRERGWLLHDEAAKVVNPRSWSEFWRAAKPGCEIGIYSVPTGDRQCTFQRIADNAVPADSIVPADTPPLVVEQLLRPGAIGTPESIRTLARDLGNRIWVRFHSPKTIMPHPFWCEERRQEFVGFYGGPDEPGYVHNVLGLPGDPEYSLFPERLLKPALTWIPDYLSVSFRWDSRAGQLDGLSRRLNPSYPWGDEGPEAASAPSQGRVGCPGGSDAGKAGSPHSFERKPHPAPGRHYPEPRKGRAVIDLGRRIASKTCPPMPRGGGRDCPKGRKMLLHQHDRVVPSAVEAGGGSDSAIRRNDWLKEDEGFNLVVARPANICLGYPRLL